MNVLSRKMYTAKGEFLGRNCRLFFPFNEGGGTVFHDIASGVSFNDAGATFSAVHTARIDNNGETNVIQGRTPTIRAGDSVIFMSCHITNLSDSFNVCVVGEAGDRLGLTTRFDVSKDGVVVSADFAVGVSGQTHFRCGTFNGKTGELRTYSGINGGSVSFQNSADGSSVLGGIDLPNNILIGGSAAFVADYYFLALLLVANLPEDSTLIEYLDWTYQEVLKGHKVLHPELAKY